MRNLFALLVLLCTSVQAHHSAVAYDAAESVSVTGTLVDLQWRNPHVLIDLEVPNESGGSDIWILETAGISNLIAEGWNRDLLAKGSTITAEIRPKKSGEPGGILRWVTLADGRVLPIDRESPASGAAAVAASVNSMSDDSGAALDFLADASRDTFEARRAANMAREELSRPETLPVVDPAGGPGAMDPDNLAIDRPEPPFDMTGIWQFRREPAFATAHDGAIWDFLPMPKLTEKAQEIYDETWRRRNSGEVYLDPTAQCYPPGMPRIMTRVGNWMAIQSETAIYMVHRFNNDFRTIFLDGRGHVDPSVRIDSYNGDSIGTWDGDTLYVDTIGFGMPNQFVQAGVPMGEQARVQERMYMLNDGNTLAVEYVITDPEHWEGEWIDTKFFDRVQRFDIQEANCIAAEDVVIPSSGISAPVAN